MRIATWNVNGLRARLDFVVHWLRARRPDVAALQELKLVDEDFPSDVLEAEGYHAVTHGQKAWNGVAILSRRPLAVVERGLPGQDAFGARLVTADIGAGGDLGDGRDVLRFTSLYCPNGKHTGHPDFAAKLDWFDALADHLEANHDPARPHVLGGDYNICPTGLDSWNEERFRGGIFHTDEERQRVARLVDWGLVDLFRATHPESRAFSWWDYRGGAFHRKQGLRIDFLLATSPVAERLRAVEIDREYRKKQDGLIASDHAPVWADLED